MLILENTIIRRDIQCPADVVKIFDTEYHNKRTGENRSEIIAYTFYTVTFAS